MSADTPLPPEAHPVHDHAHETDPSGMQHHAVADTSRIEDRPETDPGATKRRAMADPSGAEERPETDSNEMEHRAMADTSRMGDRRETDPSGMEHRRERIRIETERCRIVGYLTLARDGYRSRVSDVLNAPERDFLTLTEATVEPLAGGPVELHDFLTVARGHIVFAVPAPPQ